MITEEQAKQLKVGDTVHFIEGAGQKCLTGWIVIESYLIEEGLWGVCLQNGLPGRRAKYAYIREGNTDSWHMPGQCPTPSRLLQVTVTRIWDGVLHGCCFVDIDDTQPLRKGQPLAILIQDAQAEARKDLPAGA